MNMYNLIHGVNPIAELLLKVIGKEPEDFGRFRDIQVSWSTKQEKRVIRVITRNGGEDREDHMPKNIKEYPGYLDDYDANDDDTYAFILFNIPEAYQEILNYCPLHNGKDPLEVFSGIETQLVKLLRKNGVEVVIKDEDHPEGFEVFGVEALE